MYYQDVKTHITTVRKSKTKVCIIAGNYGCFPRMMATVSSFLGKENNLGEDLDEGLGEDLDEDLSEALGKSLG